MKLFRIKSVVVNSQFTKSFIDKEYLVNSEVIYPPVDVRQFKSGKKENTILYVGRFSQLTQSKNQHILVNNFKKLYDSGVKNWKLILAGGGELSEKEYIEELKKSSKSYPISVIVSPTFEKVKDLYSKSKIFWSAVGYGIDEIKQPLKVEHFGITVVEAMSAGLVPIIPEKGGFKEIIQNDSGLFWNDESNLLEVTQKLINDPKTLKVMSKEAITNSHDFSLENFEKSFEKYI